MVKNFGIAPVVRRLARARSPGESDTGSAVTGNGRIRMFMSSANDLAAEDGRESEGAHMPRKGRQFLRNSRAKSASYLLFDFLGVDDLPRRDGAAIADCS
jgi:hypothetical protein